MQDAVSRGLTGSADRAAPATDDGSAVPALDRQGKKGSGEPTGDFQDKTKEAWGQEVGKGADKPKVGVCYNFQNGECKRGRD